MTRKILALMFAGAASVCTAQAATDNDFDPVKSFKAFRQEVLDDYSSFRNGILKNYAKFLEGEWVEYDKHEGEDRYSSPKPKVAPLFRDTVVRNAVCVPPPKPPVVVEPIQTVAPMVEEVEIEEPAKKFTFDFYGIPVEVSDYSLNMEEQLSGPKDYGRFWRTMADDANAAAMVCELFKVAQKMQLNDYLTYELVAAYIRQNFESAHSSAQTALAHFLLANMGYGVRVAATTSGDGLLLMPFDRKVYGRPYMNIDGVEYHVFLSDGTYPSSSTRIITCPLPAGADTGSAFNLELGPLNIPVKAKKFNFAYGDIELKGEINENLFPIIYRYPQMDIREYAVAVLDPELRENLVGQLKKQLTYKPHRQAIDELLQFTQSAFEYATDDVAHGFEKPYFLEEILFYPQCDCEDRVIFYTYMLWNVLKVENQLITYPLHESAAVRLERPIRGDSYEYDGSTFYISDPTYIGAVTGQCMPQFVDEATELEYHYHQ